MDEEGLLRSTRMYARGDFHIHVADVAVECAVFCTLHGALIGALRFVVMANFGDSLSVCIDGCANRKDASGISR